MFSNVCINAQDDLERYTDILNHDRYILNSIFIRKDVTRTANTNFIDIMASSKDIV